MEWSESTCTKGGVRGRWRDKGGRIKLYTCSTVIKYRHVYYVTAKCISARL